MLTTPPVGTSVERVESLFSPRPGPRVRDRSRARLGGAQFLAWPHDDRQRLPAAVQALVLVPRSLAPHLATARAEIQPPLRPHRAPSPHALPGSPVLHMWLPFPPAPACREAPATEPASP